jgi:hypothetical protein
VVRFPTTSSWSAERSRPTTVRPVDVTLARDIELLIGFDYPQARTLAYTYIEAARDAQAADGEHLIAIKRASLNALRWLRLVS